MRKIAVGFFILILLLSITGCEKPLAEQAAEETGKPAIADENGSSIEEEILWPDTLSENLPQLNGRVISVIDNGVEGGTVHLAAIEPEEAVAYVQKLKVMGYAGTEIIYDNGFISFNSTKEDGKQSLSFYYHPAGGSEKGQSTCMVSYEKQTEGGMTSSNDSPKRAICKYLPKT